MKSRSYWLFLCILLQRNSFDLKHCLILPYRKITPCLFVGFKTRDLSTLRKKKTLSTFLRFVEFMTWQPQPLPVIRGMSSRTTNPQLKLDHQPCYRTQAGSHSNCFPLPGEQQIWIFTKRWKSCLPVYRSLRRRQNFTLQIYQRYITSATLARYTAKSEELGVIPYVRCLSPGCLKSEYFYLPDKSPSTR